MRQGIVIYKSKYGSTKKYAAILRQRRMGRKHHEL